MGAGGSREHAAALKTGATDASIGSIFAMAPLKVAGEARELLSVGDYFSKDWVETSFVASHEVIARKAEVVVKVIKAFFNAATFVQEDKAWSIRAMQSPMGYTDAEQAAR